MKQSARSAWMVLIVVVLAAAALALRPASAVAAGTAPITVPFDHLTTGFELDGVHRDLPCESCHLNAVFRGTPLDCGTCHITGSPFNATPKTATHIATTNNCAACHNTISFRPDVHFDHAEVLGSCVSCHNGTIAQGEGPSSPGHQPELRRLPHGDELESTQGGRSFADSAGGCRLLHRLPQRRAGLGQAGRARSHEPRVRRLPHDHQLARGELRSCRHHHRLFLLPQRSEGGGQAGQSHAHHQSLRELPHQRDRDVDAELGAVGIRPRADDGHDLPDLPQRQRQDLHRRRVGSAQQPRAADPFAGRLRRMPRQYTQRRDLERARGEYSDAARGAAGQQLSAVPRRPDVRRRSGAVHPDVHLRRYLRPMRQRWRRRTFRSSRARTAAPVTPLPIRPGASARPRR